MERCEQQLYYAIITSSLILFQTQTNVYGLLLPSKSDSSSYESKPHPQRSRDDHVTTDDITTVTSEPTVRGSGNELATEAPVQLQREHKSQSSGEVEVRRGRREGERGRREEGRRNRQSVVVEGDMEENGSEIQVRKFFSPTPSLSFVLCHRCSHGSQSPKVEGQRSSWWNLVEYQILFVSLTK